MDINVTGVLKKFEVIACCWTVVCEEKCQPGHRVRHENRVWLTIIRRE